MRGYQPTLVEGRRHLKRSVIDQVLHFNFNHPLPGKAKHLSGLALPLWASLWPEPSSGQGLTMWSQEHGQALLAAATLSTRSASSHRAAPHQCPVQLSAGHPPPDSTSVTTLPDNLKPSPLTDSEAIAPQGWADLPAVQLLSWLISECLMFDLLLLPCSWEAICICAVLHPQSSLLAMGWVFFLWSFSVLQICSNPHPNLVTVSDGSGKIVQDQTENSLKRRVLQFDYFY